jgi:membrane fusion protein (multidrug efflux system)
VHELGEKGVSRAGDSRVPPLTLSAYLVAICAVAVTLCAPLAGCHGKKPAPATAVPGVGVFTVMAKPLVLFTEMPGRTSPYQTAEVRPQIDGIVKKREFQEGSAVKAFEPLYQIDPAAYQALYDSGTASLAKAKANLTTANLLVDRYRELTLIHAISTQTNDNAIATALQAAADVASAKAAVESAQINLRRTRITAPIAGRIGRSTVTVGALVAANQSTALSTIQQMDPIYVDVTETVTELLRLKREFAEGSLSTGGSAHIKVKLLFEDGSAFPIDGRLEFSDVTVDQTTGSVTLRAQFPNPKEELLPGMYVRAILEEGVRTGAILVPQQGITHDAAGKATALVLGPDQKVELRELTVNRAIGDQWLVDSGLKPGDRVIVDGLQRVKPGMTARVMPPVTPGAADPGGAIPARIAASGAGH